ncbi:NAD(+)/NADH kinase [Porphyromonas somerae]|uniref:NAD(+)/NADH kinase n=1 Tax=Porphyromonas somerae TaxID=322095 RepID=UPI0003802FBD|nr:NAD(+)/NADH kinase [Porphyromonas somerae]
MKILLCGSVHQKSDPETFRQLIKTILALHPEHSLQIEQRLYTYLLSEGFSLGGISICTPRGVVDTDLLISVGGDGTFLRTAKLIAGTKAGIIGINSGHLGFLASLQPEDFPHFWKELEEGTALSEERDLLECFVTDPEGRETFRALTLNEVAVMKRDTASMISVATYINGELIANTDGDGQLISTPTGSTAYALSVNGPVVHPHSPVVQICSIAPHTLNMRPIVLPNSVEIELHIDSRSGAFLLAIDGKSHPESIGATVHIRRSEKRLKVLHSQHYSFYQTLRQKLMWGQDPRL